VSLVSGDYQHLAVDPVKLDALGLSALGTQPGDFLASVSRQAPTLGIVNRQGVDFARPQTLELRWAISIGTFSQLLSHGIQ
jgi:hypothetical protein